MAPPRRPRQAGDGARSTPSGAVTAGCWCGRSGREATPGPPALVPPELRPAAGLRGVPRRGGGAGARRPCSPDERALHRRGRAQPASGVLAFGLQGVAWLGWSLVRRLFGWGPYITDQPLRDHLERCAPSWSARSGSTCRSGRGWELFPEVEAAPDHHQRGRRRPAPASMPPTEVVTRIEEQTAGTVDMQQPDRQCGFDRSEPHAAGRGRGRQSEPEPRLALHGRTRQPGGAEHLLHHGGDPRHPRRHRWGRTSRWTPPRTAPPTGKRSRCAYLGTSWTRSPGWRKKRRTGSAASRGS